MCLHRLLFLGCVVSGVPFGTAHAKDGTSTPVEYQFGDDLIHGSNKTSAGEVLYVRKRDARASLVRAREHWLPELYRSIEDL
jgi:hypothetical protein